jgi:pimeloyl-ACP methyl ester carboxylesterase
MYAIICRLSLSFYRALLIVCLLVASATDARAYTVDFGPGFKTQLVNVAGSTISVTVGGHGPAVVLLHGYAEDSRMWKPLAAVLAPRFTVIAPDLPGIGNSSIPRSGLDMKTAAMTIRSAVHSLGYRKVRVVGHDIGLMVAYAYAALYPQEVEKLVLMDAFLPGVSGWKDIYDNPMLWHFRFTGDTPLALVQGRERTYFDYYWDAFAASKNRSLSEVSRNEYTQAYSRPGRMAAGWAYFEAFPKTAQDFAVLAKQKLVMPVLAMGGDKANGVALGAQARLVASNVTVIILKDSGHWLLEERPAATTSALSRFL